MKFDPEVPIIGILRGFTNAQVIETVQAAVCGGLKNLEITMGSAHTVEQIREAREIVGGKMAIGAGTVVNLNSLDDALDAGASFIVTPVANLDVVRECVHRDVPVFPGAFTPTEIVAAWEAGASMVKIFPADTVGPKYIKALKGPFPNIKLMPTGGVDLKTLPAFVNAGAEAFGIGGPLFDRERIEAEDWKWVEDQCRAFVEAYRVARRAL
jgi:2-dehydro-3-deoxyphosphogluconate aldolase / (4S)-4-hydroxy-2-oxoglutarate aldolase